MDSAMGDVRSKPAKVCIAWSSFPPRPEYIIMKGGKKITPRQLSGKKTEDTKKTQAEPKIYRDTHCFFICFFW